MKKIIALLFTFLMLFAMVACDSENENYNNYNSSSKPNSNKNSNTKVEEIIYNTVSFQTNGGTKVQSQSIKTLKEAPKTTKDGYLFEGWFLDETLTRAVVYPLSIDNDMILYAKWLKIADKTTCTGTKIKWDSDYSETVVYNITPSGFDTDRLTYKNYSHIYITVTYNVYYKKDYDVLWDIGYMGSPKYELSITNKDGTGIFEEDLTTKTTSQTRTITYQADMADLKNNKISLKFSTNNIQNIIYFDNITVTYQCK